PRPSRKNNDRARTESRKLLAHVLQQLRERTMPPSVFSAFKVGLGSADTSGLASAFGVVRGAVKFTRASQPRRSVADNDYDEDDEDGEPSSRGFSTDATIALLIQLREILVLSTVQGWHILDDGEVTVEDDSRPKNRKSVSPFRRSRTTDVRSPSPSSSYSGHLKVLCQTPELLSSCIQVLASVVSEDCRYQTSHPSAAYPPKSLQAVALHVAHHLLYNHRDDPRIVAQIGFAMIPAFATFPEEMYGWLLTFFETLLRGASQTLVDLRAIGEVLTDISNGTEPSEAPIVSIQIEEAQDAPTASWSQWSGPGQREGLVSVEAPSQPLPLYYLASLLPPFIAAALECLRLPTTPPTHSNISHLETLRIWSARRFWNLMMEMGTSKPDWYLDVLNVLAYHHQSVRLSTAMILMDTWGRAVGHAVVSQPPSIPFFVEDPAVKHTVEDNVYAHQFVPWRFVLRAGESPFKNDCHCCEDPIDGFGLLCPFCFCRVHFDCYDCPSGCHIVEYSLDDNVQKMAIYRFSNLLDSRRDAHPFTMVVHDHVFQYANLFTLCLCLVCHEPLWGCTAQGLRCRGCGQFAHAKCLENITPSGLNTCSGSSIDASDIVIGGTTLRQSCWSFYDNTFRLSQDDLQSMSYEQVSVLHAMLWTQLQILDNGIALGSIVVNEKGKGKEVEGMSTYQSVEFELHRVTAWCESLLKAGSLPVSGNVSEFLDRSRISASSHALMFDWSHLAYITTTIKSPFTVDTSMSVSSSPGFLNVESPIYPDEDSGGQSRGENPYEIASVGHMRDVLGHELAVHSDEAAKYLLSHLHQLGFFERLDSHPVLFTDTASDKSQYCIFPLPLGLDISMSVETLVSAIEACLDDVDLFVNEVGFLFLLRRFHPNGMLSDYAEKRLAKTVISWILEGERLASSLLEYMQTYQVLPGVRTGENLDRPWPPMRDSRPTDPGNKVNVGDYIAFRRHVLQRYAVPWLMYLHDQDPSLYGQWIYEICQEFSSEDDYVRHIFRELDSDKGHVASHDKFLYCLSKLAQSSVMFTALDDVFIRWLESVSSHSLHEHPMNNLRRLLKDDNAKRSTTMILPNLQEAPTIDPWRALKSTANASVESFSSSVRWLCVIARSGIELPSYICSDFVDLAASFTASLSDSLTLVEAIMSTVWLRSLGRVELQGVVGCLDAYLAERSVSPYYGSVFCHFDAIIASLRFVRMSLATCLLLYGCDRAKLLSLGLVLQEEVENLPSRRKMASAATGSMDPIIVDPRITGALFRYLAVNHDLTCIVAKFLKCLMESPFLESYEIDNFVLRNGQLLNSCAWELYGIQRDDISNIRPSLLLRVLVVDSQPFHEVLNSWLNLNNPWEQRLEASVRLTRIVWDSLSPHFAVEDRQWRVAVVDIFRRFFSLIWADTKEEIRLMMDTATAGLHPAHFDAISACWSDYMTKSPIAERWELVSFLVRLHPHFPRWKGKRFQKVLKSTLISFIKCLLGKPLPTHFQKTNIIKSNKMTVALLVLSLQMLSDSILIDLASLVRVKYHLAELLGFSNVAVVQSGQTSIIQYGDFVELPEVAYTCISELMPVIDAYTMVELPSSLIASTPFDDEQVAKVLIGAAFVDLLLNLVSSMEVDDLSKLPVLTLKSLLEMIGIIVYKYDFDSKGLKYLQSALRKSVARVAELLLQELSYELRQIALSVTQAFIKRWFSLWGVMVYTAIENVAKLIAEQSRHGHDALIIQAKGFISSLLMEYASGGLFANLMKKSQSKEFFLVIKQIIEPTDKSPPVAHLPSVLLRDTLGRVNEVDRPSIPTFVGNILTYVELIYHEGYTGDLMLYVGQQLVQLARRTVSGDHYIKGIETEPFIEICTILLQHNKFYGRDLLPSVDAILRILLPRLSVHKATLSKLLDIGSTFYRKTPDKNIPQSQNTILLSLIELMTDGLRIKSPVQPQTLQSIIEVITDDESAALSRGFLGTRQGLIADLVDPGLSFLQYHTWPNTMSQQYFSASMAVGNVVLQAAESSIAETSVYSEETLQKHSRHSFTVRTWNILLLAGLLDKTESYITLLFAHLSSFAMIHHATLRVYLQAGTNPSDAAITDINHAYVAIKLWIMLAMKKSVREETGNEVAMMVWNELWPPFENVVRVFEAQVQSGLSVTLSSLTWSTIADLFIFLRSVRSPVAMQMSSHIATLNRLRNLGGQRDAATGKASHKIAIVELPEEVDLDVLVNQAAADIVATEKLRVLENGRIGYEKPR
ncbi:hypothetical protein FISHEDRAFT_10379, partial [Fistulina hepatica ATCC 64428]